jgi:hypothetical protein
LIKFQKNIKKRQKTMKPQNLHFWYICIIFSIFDVISEQFKFSKVFGTHSTVNALILQSLIFLVESTLILLILKKYKKNMKIEIYKKQRKEKKKKSWGISLKIWQHFAYKY